MKIFRSRLFYFLIGIILSGSVAYAAGRINASEITYTDKNNVEKTVDVVLDDLYNKANQVNLGSPASLVVEEVSSTVNTGSVTISNINNYKWYYMNSVTWHCSNSDKDARVNSLKISSITNGSYIEIGNSKGKYSTTQSAGSIGYIIYPDGSGNDITITFSSADATSIYGIK